MIVYAFDCDETLEISGGPVLIRDVAALRDEGHIVGVCGNWNLATHHVDGWQHLWAFLGPVGTPKPEFLRQLMQYLPRAYDYVLVGNDHSAGAFTSPDDATHAREAGWRFIREVDFAAGAR